jgi:hypothetical protein
MSLKFKLLLVSLTLWLSAAAIAQQPIISVTPPALNFENVAVNSDSIRTITISNSGTNQDLMVNDLAIIGTNPTQFSLVNPPALPLVLSPGASSSPIEVRFAPTSFGQKFAFLRIISNDPDPGRDTLNVVLNGTGLAPDIDADPNPLQFGQLTVNTELTLTVNLTNTGNINLNISSLQITGANANQFSLVSPPVPPVIIPPNGNPVPVQVRFRPTSAGAKTAVVRIASNDPDENPFDVSLTGTGISPTISITPTSLNFGNVLVNTDSILTLSIFNIGQGNLFIDSFDIVSDPDTLFSLVNPPSLPATIPPGGGPLTIEVKFSPEFEGNEVAFLLITHNDLTQNPLSVPLSGKGVFAQITVSPDTLSYGNVTVTDFLDSIVQVSNSGEGPLFIDDARIIGANANQFSLPTLPPLPIKINPGAPPVTIQVRFAPDSIGFKQAFFVLISNDPDPPVSVALEGVGVKPDIVAFPPEIDFGEVAVGDSGETTTTIKNAGNVDLIVSDIAIAGTNSDQFTFSEPPLPFTLRPAIDSVVISVQFAPTSGGTKNAVLRFVNNTPDKNPYDVPLAGTGTVPDIAANPNPLDIGDVLLGEHAEGIVNILNEGRAPLIISDTALAGAHARLFSIISLPQFPIIIPPDTAMMVTVRFQPDSLGLKTAKLQITSDDPDENPFTIDLRGTGVQPDIGTNPDTLNFDSVRVENSSIRVLEILNTGTAPLVIDTAVIVDDEERQFAIENIRPLPDTIFVNGEPKRVEIKFTPASLGVKTATLRIFSNAPDTLDVQLSGTGVEPDIAVSPETLNFGKVVVNVGDERILTLQNLGGAPLSVDSVAITGEDAELFSIVSPVFPDTVLPNDSLPVRVQFIPDTLGDKFAQLIVSSDDPDEPTLIVPATGTGAIPVIVVDSLLGFGNVAINTGKKRTLTIANTGSGPLRIDSIFTSEGNADEFFISVMPPLPFTIAEDGSEVIEITFQPKTNEPKTTILKILSNDPNNPISDVLLQGRGVRPPVINDFIFSEILLNQDVAVTANVSADTVIQSVVLHYGPGNRLDFPAQQPLEMQSPGIYSGTIEGQAITTSGLNMALEVTDAFPATTRDTLYNTVNVPASAVRDTFTTNHVNRWMMYSVPFDPVNASISNVLQDLGSEGDFTWRIYRTDTSGVNSNYYSGSSLNTMGDYGRFKPGNAFWLYLRDDDQGSIPTNIIALPEMNTVPVDSFSYTLQQGWNQLASPYAFGVTWNQVESKHKDTLQVYRFDGGNNFTLLTTGGEFQKVGWTPLVNVNFTIEPWTGYAVHNNMDFDIPITFYPLKPDSGLMQLAKTNAAGNWQIQLVAENELSYHICVAGMYSRARPGRDYLDYLNPSPVGNRYVSMFFRHEDWKAFHKDYSSDFRPINYEGEVWYFSINSSGKMVDFSVRELGDLPENFRVMVYDTKYRNKYYPDETRRVTFRNLMNGEHNRFALLVGTPGFIESEAQNVQIMRPNDYLLMENYPNPFNPVTYIRYQVARAGDVQLIIYNVLGQEVSRLADGYHNAGFYEIEWNGKTRSGTEAASGIYFYRLQVNDYVNTMKMLKLK